MQSRTVGGTATYTCSTGYTLSGSSIRTCSSSEAWGGTAPTCNAIQCPDLSHPSGGTVSISSRTPGSGIAVYRCNTGNSIIGSSFLTCQPDGTWSRNAPTCQGDCDSVNYSLVADHIKGFLLHDISGYIYTLFCTQCTIFNASDFTTTVSQCPSLNSPLNGRVTTSSRAIGDTAAYSCNNGYALTGSSTRTCQSGGVWSGNEPTCQG